MAIGMTYEQYWFDDPLMVRAFYKADRLRRERMDEEAWLQGVYVKLAIDSTIGNAFRKNSQDSVEYPKEPATLTARRQEDEERKQKAQEQEAVWASAWMQSLVQAGAKWNKNKKQDGDGLWQTEQLTN